MTSPREIIAQGSKSFAMASLLLPPSVQQDVYVLYSWLRHCDDVIDSPGSSLTDLHNLQFQLSSGIGPSVAAQMQQLIRRRKLPAVYFDEFFEGLRMDLENKAYETQADLELYCYRVAGVVGLILCPLIGALDARALPHACSLGVGMQLTNICRDVLEDARNNRVYLPLQISQSDLKSEDVERLPELAKNAVRYLLARAEEKYQEGNKGLKYLPFRVAFAIASSGLIYRAIGRKVLRNLPQSLEQRTVVRTIEKLACLLCGFCLAVRSRFD